VQRKDGGGMENYRELLGQLSSTEGVVASAPALYGVILASNGNRSSQMVIKGVDAAAELKVGNLLTQVREGSIEPLKQPYDPSATPSVVIGRVMAQTLGARVGDTILLTSPQGHMTPFGMVPRYERFRVAGVFDSGFYDFDSNWAFTSLAAAQRLLSLGDVVSVLEFKVADIYQAVEIATGLQQAAGPDYGSTHWMEQNRALFSALSLEKTVTVITISLIVFVAALNILISLVMMVMEKYRDVAVLVSMGARERNIRRIFQLQGILIGIAGTAIGLAAGYLLAWLGSHYQVLKLNADIYSIDYVPFNARLIDGVWVAAVALLISFLATLYPARNAARITPAEALRYE
jgi:lipoprotein-releasing system permease protein